MLKIGIDELGTEKQVLLGYAFIMLNNEAHDQLVANTKALISTSGVNVFHGKKYKSHHRDNYKKFLKIIKNVVENSEPSLLCVTLNTDSVNDDLTAFFDRLFHEVFGQVLPIEAGDLTVLNSFIPYILSFQKACNHMQLGAMEASIEIDSDDVKEKLCKVVVKQGRREMSGAWLIKTFCNAYRKRQFPGAPKLTDSIISMSGSKSALVQAADVFANFLLSHMLVLTGHESIKRKEKSDLLLEVFGDQIVIQQNLLNQIKRVGDSDIDLDVEGAVTYRYGYQ